MMPTEKSLTREEEERLIALSIIPLIPLFGFISFYLLDLTSKGIIPSYQALFGYIILAGTLVLVAGCGIYEVASSFKVKVPLLFRVKRFLSRALFFSAFVLGFYAFWVFFSLLLSSVLRVEYIVLLSLLSWSLTISILAKNPKTGQFIKKLTMEE
jgi:hypothetical protein